MERSLHAPAETLIHADAALLPEGWTRDCAVRIGSDGRIEAVGPQGSDGAPDRRVGALLPAPANLHSHSFQRAMAGLTEARGPDATDSFWTWRRLMYRFLDRLTPDDIEVIAALAFAEMLEAGFAAVGEFHYLHHAPGGVPYAAIAELSERIAAAAEGTGIGLTLLPVLYEVGGCGGQALDGGQLRFGNDPGRFAKLLDAARAAVATLPDAVVGVAPHSLRAVTAEGLKQAVDLAGEGPIHIHVAEQLAEVEEVLAHRGARPMEWLLDNHPVGPAWCPIHCTQMTIPETQSLAATGAVAGLCPITEASLGDGIFDGTAFLRAGGMFGVGTDSNVQIALWGELRMLEYSQRLRDRTRASLADRAHSTGRVLFDHACAGGAQATRRASGRIAEGKWADLIGIDPAAEAIVARQGDQILDTLVFAARGASSIADVWSAGRHVVRNGRHIEREALTQRFRATLTRLREAI